MKKPRKRGYTPAFHKEAKMKALICLIALLALGACETYQEEQARLAASDHAFCSQVWGSNQEGYGNCRMMKSAQRSQGKMMAAGLGGQMLLNQQQQNYAPAPYVQRPVTCYQQGYYTTCN